MTITVAMLLDQSGSALPCFDRQRNAACRCRFGRGDALGLGDFVPAWGLTATV